MKNSKTMVVIAHPDDELLGFGVIMNKLISESGFWSLGITLFTFLF